MPRQNRVTPFGDIVASSARGTLMGNRGCLHDASGRITRLGTRSPLASRANRCASSRLVKS